MGGVIAVIAGDPGKNILVILARHQIAIRESLFAEIGKQRIAAAVYCDRRAVLKLYDFKHPGVPFKNSYPPPA